MSSALHCVVTGGVMRSIAFLGLPELERHGVILLAGPVVAPRNEAALQEILRRRLCFLSGKLS